MIQVTDQRMLLLMEVLKQNGTIRFQQEFCDIVGIEKQNMAAIRSGRQRFTVAQIEKACSTWGVLPDFIFGYTLQVFRGKKIMAVSPALSGL